MFQPLDHLPKEFRFLSGEDSATIIITLAYSPPVENPCKIRATNNKIGVQIPICSYVGSIPINNVDNVIMIIVVVNTTLHRYLSPMIPKIMPRTGLSKNAIAKVAKVKINFTGLRFEIRLLSSPHYPHSKL